MKKFNIFFVVILIGFAISFISSCSKEEQPRYVKVEILSNTAKKINQMEKYVDDRRATVDPSGYHDLARYATDEVLSVLVLELKSPGNPNHGDVPKVVKEYNELWRHKSPKYKSSVWRRLDVGVHPDVYRYMKAYSEELLLFLKDYCQNVVNGSSEWVSGERISEKEDEIINMVYQHPDPLHEWQYSDRLYDTFLRFAEDPNKKPKKKKNGFLNFGWWN